MLSGKYYLREVRMTMKKPILKRAISAVATVPLALAQCLTFSFAAGSELENQTVPALAGESETVQVTIDKLTEVPYDYVTTPETVHTRDWNKEVSSILQNIAGESGKTVDIETKTAVDLLTKLAPGYTDMINDVIGGATDVKAVIGSDGKIVVSGNLGDIAKSVNDLIGKKIDELVEKYAEYGVKPEDFGEVSFDATYLDKFEATIDGSKLAAETKVPVSYSIIGEDGQKYTIDQTADNISGAIADLKKSIEDSAAKLPANDGNALVTDVDGMFTQYENLLATYDSVLDTYPVKVVDADSTAQALQELKNWATANNHPTIASHIPESATAVLTSDKGIEAFNTAVAKFNEVAGTTAQVAFTAEELGGFIDEDLYDINAESKADGTINVSASFTDEQKDAVDAFYQENFQKKVVDSHKEIEVNIDYTAVKDGEGSVEIVRFERYLTLEDLEETTTSTTTTTTDASASTPAQTETTPVGGSDNGTETTPAGGTETTPAGGSGSETTTTPAGGSGEVTTTTTGKPDVPGPDAQLDHTYAVVEAEPGYYFSHDNTSFDTNQIKSLDIYEVYDDGAEVKASVVDFTKLSFGGATPQSTYDEANIEFKYAVEVYYDGEVLKDEAGNNITVTAYIGVKGDTDLNNAVDSSDASLVLQFYAAIQTGGTYDDTYIKDVDDPEIENLAVFLSDVDKDEYDPANFETQKTEANHQNASRVLDSSDASYILNFYAQHQTTTDKTPFDIWSDILGELIKGNKADAA